MYVYIYIYRSKLQIGIDQSSKPLPREDDDDDDREKAAGPENLFEQRWFFNNLLDRKISMSRNSNHPCTSSDDNSPPAGKSYDETYESLKKLSRPPTSLMRASPSLERKDSNPIAKGSKSTGRRKPESETAPLSSNLARSSSTPAASLAPEDIREEEDEEIEFSMGKLIRQASLENTPGNHVAKGVPSVSSCSTSSPRKVEFGNRKLERLRPRRMMNQLKTQKSLSDLESFELQGFKDLGFDVGVKQQTAITMIPESHEGEDHGRNAPKWGGKRSKEDDIKAQIKFWARAVASNVNQE